MILEKIRADKLSAVKSNDSVTRDILNVVLGGIELIQSRGKVMTDNEITSSMEKIIEGNLEVLRYTHDKSKTLRLLRENDILGRYIPKKLSKNEISDLVRKYEFCQPNVGLAMKATMAKLRELNLNANGNLVKEVIEEMNKC